jgi:hypothetical protein
MSFLGKIFKQGRVEEECGKKKKERGEKKRNWR